MGDSDLYTLNLLHEHTLYNYTLKSMRLEWVWLFTRWYAEIVNQSARRDDTRRDAPLRYVRPASYCEPGFT